MTDEKAVDGGRLPVAGGGEGETDGAGTDADSRACAELEKAFSAMEGRWKSAEADAVAARKDCERAFVLKRRAEERVAELEKTVKSHLVEMAQLAAWYAVARRDLSRLLCGDEEG